MEDDDVTERLWKIVDGLYVRPRVTSLLGMLSPPFEISKPNMHDSKADFLAEMAIVDAALKHLDGLKKTLRAAFQEDDANHAVASACVEAVDEIAKGRPSRAEVEFPIQLVVENATRLGASLTTLFLAFELHNGFYKRKQELEAQREEFWQVSGRPPNHYARTIALRLAKEVARYTGKKPTFGTARDGGHPSTDFGRALDEIFRLLGLDAQVKHPAMWAISQLTLDDLNPEPVNALAGLLHPSTSRSFGMVNALAELENAPTKDGDQ